MRNIKKVLCLFISLLMVFTSITVVFAQETENLDGTLSIPSYNKTYSVTPPNNEMISLDEYNAEYANGKSPLRTTNLLTLENASEEILNTLSAVKSQTKPIILANNGTQVGTIKLSYQTAIQGGRPQFVYDTCTIGHPNLTTYWSLEYSYVDFSGDRIGVYFSFIYGAFQDHAWVYFYPN